MIFTDYSNEAGAPGSDVIYGSGNLNLGRVMEREVLGITDATQVTIMNQTETLKTKLK